MLTCCLLTHPFQFHTSISFVTQFRTSTSFVTTNSTIKVANQRFIAHLHSLEEGGTCDACIVNEDRGNLVPILEDPTASTSVASGSTIHTTSTRHAPMDEKTAKTFTKEEKKHNFRTNMQSLRKNLLAGGVSAPLPGPSKATAAKGPEMTSDPCRGDSGDESSSTSIQAPRYVDRAKLRRSIHPPQHGLSDADPPQGKRSRLSSPSSMAPPRQSEPSYGPGAALFQKMMMGDSDTGNTDEIEGGTTGISVIQTSKQKEVKMGKVIEVRTMAERTAGLGSGAVREGVEQHADPVDWRDTARQRRWREANR